MLLRRPIFDFSLGWFLYACFFVDVYEVEEEEAVVREEVVMI